MGIFSRKLVVHRFSRDVFLFKKGIENQFTLAGELQLMLPEMLFQHPYLLRMLGHSAGHTSSREVIKDQTRHMVKGMQVRRYAQEQV